MLLPCPSCCHSLAAEGGGVTADPSPIRGKSEPDFHTLGGAGINADLIQCYNDEISRRTPGGAHGREAAIGPRLSERNLAAAQGISPMPPVRGVQHKESGAKVARSCHVRAPFLPR